MADNLERTSGLSPKSPWQCFKVTASSRGIKAEATWGNYSNLAGQFTCTLLAHLRKCLISSGAGEGNRTLVSDLGSPRSTIEPHPLRVPRTCNRDCLVAQLFDASGLRRGRI